MNGGCFSSNEESRISAGLRILRGARVKRDGGKGREETNETNDKKKRKEKR